MSLKNKIVFITGASSGIGAACAKAFSEEGAKLILAARRLPQIKALADTLKTETHLMELDVREKYIVQEKINMLPKKWKNVDILINNAGLAKGLFPIQEGSLEDWEEMIDTNLKGLLYVTHAIIPTMVARNTGHIINMGSIAGIEVYPQGNVYCATKSAVSALSRAMKLDTVKHHIKVTEILPGLVETEFSMVRFEGDKEKAKKVYEGLKPLSSQDIAETVLYVAKTPPHVNIQQILITPTAQASVTVVHRE